MKAALLAFTIGGLCLAQLPACGAGSVSPTSSCSSNSPMGSQPSAVAHVCDPLPATWAILTDPAEIDDLSTDVTNVHFECRDIRPASLERLAKHRNLRQVSLNGTNVDHDGVAALTASKCLSELELSRCDHLDSDALRSVTRIGKLQELSLDDTVIQLSEVGAREVLAFPELRFLSVARCNWVTDDWLATIVAPNLSHLDVSGCMNLRLNLPAAVLPLQGLKFLVASALQLGPQSTLNLVSLPRLQSLDLGMCTGLAIAETSQHVGKDLRSLYIAGCNELSERDLDDLTNYGVSALALDKSSWLSDDALAKLASMRNLRELVVGGSPNVTDRAFETFTSASKLIKVTLVQLPKVTGASLEHLAKLPALRELGVIQCDGISEVTARKIASEVLQVTHVK